MRGEAAKVQEAPGDALKDFSRYSRDLWVRLNGGTTTVGPLTTPQGMPLPQPAESKEVRGHGGGRERSLSCLNLSYVGWC